MTNNKAMKQRTSREEVALLEVGNTSFSSSSLPALIIFSFLLVVFSVLLVDVVLSKNKISEKAVQLLEIVPTVDELKYIKGQQGDNPSFRRLLNVNQQALSEINKFENDLSDESSITQYLIPKVQQFNSSFLKVGNDKAFYGRDKWLFYSIGVEYLYKGGFFDKNSNYSSSLEPIGAIVEFDKFLKSQGIKLIIMPTPVKAMIYPEKLSSRFRNYKGALQNRSYENFIEILADKNIAVCDPTKELILAKKNGSKVFLDHDTHWTPQGMKIAAQKLARQIRKLKNPLIYHRYQSHFEEISSYGDIQRMLKLPEYQKIFKQESINIEKIKDPNGNDWQANDNSEILLLGDSFSNIFSFDMMKWGQSAGLAEQLSFQLQTPIDTILQNDNGAYATREKLYEFLSRGKNKLDKKKVVVWQFAMRELYFGNWKDNYDWKIPEKNIAQRETSKSGTTKAIIKVISKSRIPDVSKSDYPNCLYTFKAKVHKLISGPKVPESLILKTWAFKDRKLLGSAKIKENDFLLVDFISVPKKLERLQTSDQIIDFSLKMFWLENFSFTDAIKPQYNNSESEISINHESGLENPSVKSTWKWITKDSTLSPLQGRSVYLKPDSTIYSIKNDSLREGDTVYAEIKLWSYTPMKISVIVARHGLKPFEGKTQTVDIGNIPKTIRVSHTFENSHDAYRLQLKSHSNGTLYFGNQSLEKLNKNNDINFSFVNQEISNNLHNFNKTISTFQGLKSWLNELKPFQRKLFEKLNFSKKATTFVGEDNFLFCRNRSKSLANFHWQNEILDENKIDAVPFSRALESITGLHSFLKKKGIHLVVVPIPTRGEIYPEKIVKSFKGPPVAPQRFVFIKKLLESGVDSIDLLPLFQAEKYKKEHSLYMKDDTHWNTPAILVASKYLATKLSPHPIVKKQTKRNFQLSKERGIWHCNLLSTLPTEIDEELYRQKKERFIVKGYKASTTSPVLLCGDSFTYAMYPANLAAHLSNELGFSVDFLQRSGGGPQMPKILRRNSDGLLKDKKIVVLAFVARYLSSSEW